MPCSPSKARKLLQSGKAIVKRRTPFTIKLRYECANRVQATVAGMDTGSKTIGTAVITNGKVVYQTETHLRGEEIRRKMEQRGMYRRTRRSRKLRYRKPRFLNRRASTRLGRLPPSVRHKVESHLREKRFMESILPITDWNLETASFDIHKISNPSVSKKYGWTYQKGQQFGYYNIKAFILARDKHTCQKCSKNKQGLKLHVHHVIFKSNGGTDTPNNLITLCAKCHDGVHKLKNGVSEKTSKLLQTKVAKNTRHATEASIIRSQLSKKFGKYNETFGYITKFNREQQNLPKTHYIDAVIIASNGEIVEQLPNYFIRKLVSKGDYQLRKGSRSEVVIPIGKLFGFRKFDVVKTPKGVGYVKGKRSSGSFSIHTLSGQVISEGINVRKHCKRISARKLILTGMEVIHGN